MKAVRLHNYGDISNLKLDVIDEPICNENQIKVNIKATSINHLDVWVRKGIDKSIKLPMIIGSDGSGKIVEIGKNINKYKVGDKVLIQPGLFCKECRYCLSGKENYCKKYSVLGEDQDGTMADFICLYEENIRLMPIHLNFIEGASMPLVFMTAYQMLYNRANIKKNDIVLIYGGSSGVGSAAIQIAKQAGAIVISTNGSAEKCNYSESLGADYNINHNEDNMYESIKNITSGNGVDIVFEHIGKNTWQNSIKLLNKGGRIVTCGSTSGPNVSINLPHLFIKQQSILGSTMSDIPTFNDVVSQISYKKYKPIVDKVYHVDQIHEAYKYFDKRKHMGKIIIDHDT